MRRLEMILLMLVGILCFMACQKDNEEVPSLPDHEEVPTISDQQCNFDAAQQQKTITLDGLKAAIANVSKAEGMDWVSNVTPLAYGSGAPNVMITLTENKSMDARTGLIVFTDTKGNKVNLMITQTGVAYQPQNYAHQIRVGAEASSMSYTLSDLNTALSTIESNASWVSAKVQGYASGSGVPDIALKIEANEATSERQAVLTITAVNGDKVLLTIIQEAKPEPKTYTHQIRVGATASSETYTLSDLNTAISTIESNASWASATKQSYTSGAPSISLKIEANDAMSERQAVLTITAVNGDKVLLTIIQEAKPEPKTYTRQVHVGATASSETYTLSDLDTAISTIESNASWASATKQSYTSGAPSIALKIEANDAMSERQAVLIITANNGDKVLLTIIQEAYTIDDIHNSETNKPAYIKRR